MQTDVTVLALPHLDPGRRAQCVVPHGATIADMVAVALPGLPEERWGQLRVTIGDFVVLEALWRHARPKPGTTVIIRLLPSGTTARQIIGVAVTVAAAAVGAYYLGPLLGGLPLFSALPAGFATGAAAAASSIAASALFNALVPLRQAGASSLGGSDEARSQAYSINGLQNIANPGGAVPNVLGFHRFAPPYAALPYTEVAGDDLYVNALLNFGYGPLEIDNIRIGDNLITNYQDVSTQLIYGYPGDVLPSQFRNCYQESVETVLMHGTEVIRTTAPGATAAIVDLVFPQGLSQFDSATGNPLPLNLQVHVRLRPAGGDDTDWISWLNPWSFTEATRNPLRRSTEFALPYAGQWEIGVSRITADFDNLRQVGVVQWTGLTSTNFPGAYLSFDRPLALLAVRIKATAQLSGMISNLNADVRRICKDWDAPTQTWVTRATNNPASLFRYVLQGPATAYPKADGEINLAKLQEWHEYCAANGLTYNRVHDYVASLWDVLQDIAAAGRATPRDSGQAWDIVIDKPQSVVVGHLSPRNSWGFSGQRRYVRVPDAFRISFLDETQDFKQVEQLVPWPGFTGEPDVTEEVQFVGITNPAQIFREARRRQYELIHRPDRYTVNQDIEALVLTRGDLAVLSHDVLDRTQEPARVAAVDVAAQVVVLDTYVTIEAGVAYACRFRKADGSSLLALVGNSQPGAVRALRILGTALPAPGDLALFGVATRETFEVIVQDIETSDGPTFRLTLMDHAPQIEALVNADPLPAWAA
ncbi:host specificity factor TipJ family phage tail protein [Hyphomicrobium sp.]|uniref:host specificity factor TipJ family phage tail protein n=1 Tax=Hyphomicrobium sp. TaxID=82 RepID=UPI00132BA493|nr:host specificity factor TipJ family phage tail protein [Hyphomicrobium sp.]KAB2937399.1 MAG: hypothetical protein F9K20_20115 [Hyphomicrobium sp.]